ncbi:hypothetical protein [Auraticoccus monumenti]|uniref:PH domain-containing protein n=1 Tax=Auraticoccus monumenti TaxID=675864 RepID=A0A1G6U2V0_9ACTN|nr:hypothetical protein [Auraticoccus monumenti]SDD34917.1 hypothetical protein SAMN04489747_0762 [Auraticoccus monumenti]
MSTEERWPGELESSLRWQTGVVVASAAALVLSGVMLRERPPGWAAVVALVLGLLVVYLAVVWSRSRARMAIWGTELTVRRWRQVQAVDASEVTAVRQRLTGLGPDFVVVAGDRRLHVPTSRVRRGHSSFFEWLLAHGNDPELDRGTRRTLKLVRERGLIER